MGEITDSNDEQFPEIIVKYNGDFWKRVFFNFIIVYKFIIIIGMILFVICLISLYLQIEHPYQPKQETLEETTKSDINTKDLEENETNISTTDISVDIFNYLYSDYKVTYKGKKGVKKRKAEQILEQYLYYEWDSGIIVKPEKIIIPNDGISSSFKVINVRKINKNNVIIYIKIDSGDYAGLLVEFNIKNMGNGTFSLNYDYKRQKYKKQDNTSSPYILPISEKRQLIENDLKGLSYKELRLARNEIYARHGRLFNDIELQKYFNKQDWYNGYIEPEDFIDSEELSKLEIENAKFILAYENKQ